MNSEQHNKAHIPSARLHNQETGAGKFAHREVSLLGEWVVLEADQPSSSAMSVTVLFFCRARKPFIAVYRPC